MPRYLISFDAHAMDHIPAEDMPAVTNASLAVVQEAIDAGAWVFGGGLETRMRASWPPTERSPTARTRRPSADSVSSTYAHPRRRWSGLPRSPSPAAVLKRSGSSCPTRP